MRPRCLDLERSCEDMDAPFTYTHTVKKLDKFSTQQSKLHKCAAHVADLIVPVEIDDIHPLFSSGIAITVRHEIIRLKHGSYLRGRDAYACKTFASSPSALSKLKQNIPTFPNLSFNLSK
jgi:hypothetical protein